MRILNVVQLGALACCIALAACAAGNADGPGKSTRVEFVIGDYMPSEGGTWEPGSSPVQEPFGIDFDKRQAMYIVELTSGRLLKRDPSGQLVKLSEHSEKGFSGDGGPVGEAYFNGPHNCIVTSDDALLIADSWNHCVRRVDLNTLMTGTIAGTGKEGFSGDEGPATLATFNFVMCIELDPSKRTLHIADLKNLRVRNVDIETGVVRTVAGNGKKGVPRDGDLATDAPLVDPRAAASDANGNLYILERNGHSLRVVRRDGTIHTVAGTGTKGFRDGPALEAEFGSPKHLCCDPAGNVYIADDLNGAIRKYDPKTGQVSTLLGQGHGNPRIKLEHPHGVRWHDSSLYALDTGHNRIFKLQLDVSASER